MPSTYTFKTFVPASHVPNRRGLSYLHKYCVAKVSGECLFVQSYLLNSVKSEVFLTEQLIHHCQSDFWLGTKGMDGGVYRHSQERFCLWISSSRKCVGSCHGTQYRIFFFTKSFDLFVSQKTDIHCEMPAPVSDIQFCSCAIILWTFLNSWERTFWTFTVRCTRT